MSTSQILDSARAVDDIDKKLEIVVSALVAQQAATLNATMEILRALKGVPDFNAGAVRSGLTALLQEQKPPRTMVDARFAETINAFLSRLDGA